MRVITEDLIELKIIVFIGNSLWNNSFEGGQSFLKIHNF